MPILEEVDEGGEEPIPGGAESLKAEHRRRRASKARKKKRAEVTGGTLARGNFETWRQVDQASRFSRVDSR